MKTKEELNVLREEVEALNEKLQQLTDVELDQVTGGAKQKFERQKRRIVINKVEYFDVLGETLKLPEPCIRTGLKT